MKAAVDQTSCLKLQVRVIPPAACTSMLVKLVLFPNILPRPTDFDGTLREYD